MGACLVFSCATSRVLSVDALSTTMISQVKEPDFCRNSESSSADRHSLRFRVGMMTDSNTLCAKIRNLIDCPNWRFYPLPEELILPIKSWCPHRYLDKHSKIDIQGSEALVVDLMQKHEDSKPDLYKQQRAF